MTIDPKFWEAIRTTVLLTLVVVPCTVILALVMALTLMSGLKGAGLFVYLWAISLAISDLAAGLVWLAIFTDALQRRDPTVVRVCLKFAARVNLARLQPASSSPSCSALRLPQHHTR